MQKLNNYSNRDLYIDTLRAIGLISIMLVHSNIPRILYQINLFNVPLMIVVSGIVAGNTCKKKYQHYVMSRLKRLLIPTWIFITAYLSFLFLLSKMGVINYFDFNLHNIICSYCLLDSESGGIGFVWIIRVFILTMFITPLIARCNLLIKNDWIYSSIIICLLVFQVLLFIPSCSIVKSVWYKQVLLYFVGYQVFIWFGLRLKRINSSVVGLITFILICVDILLCLYRMLYCGMNIYDLDYKTPPYLDYQLYGMAVSSLLFYCKKVFIKISKVRLIQFIGQNTIWLYFWHIPIVITMNSLLKDFHWGIVFTITFILSCVLYYIQYKCVKKLDNNFLNKYLIG